MAIKTTLRERFDRYIALKPLEKRIRDSNRRKRQEKSVIGDHIKGFGHVLAGKVQLYLAHSPDSSLPVMSSFKECFLHGAARPKAELSWYYITMEIWLQYMKIFYL